MTGTSLFEYCLQNLWPVIKLSFFTRNIHCCLPVHSVYLRYIQSAEPLVSSSPLSTPSVASFPCGSQEQGVGSCPHSSCSQEQGVGSCPPSIASFPCCSQEQGVGSCPPSCSSQKQQGVSSWRHGYLETNMDTLDQEELSVSETAVEEEEELEEGGLKI